MRTSKNKQTMNWNEQQLDCRLQSKFSKGSWSLVLPGGGSNPRPEPFGIILSHQRHAVNPHDRHHSAPPHTSQPTPQKASLRHCLGMYYIVL